MSNSKASGTAERRPYGIADVAERFGVTLRLIRFYEDKGLITPQRLNTNRYYDDADLERLGRVLSLMRYGFTLAEARNLLDRSEAVLRAALEDRRADLVDEIAKAKKGMVELDKELRTLARKADGANG